MEYKKMQKGLDQTCRIPIRRLVIFMAALMASSISVQADERPNIVMIVADDLGRQDCGFMGGTEIKTPHLDHLARAFAIPDAHYLLPVCTPSPGRIMDNGRFRAGKGTLYEGAIRAGDWKLLVKNGDENPDGEKPAKSNQAKPKKAAVTSVMLFDLSIDPYESMNLAPDRPEKVLELKTRLDQFARQAVRPKARPKPNGFQTPQVWGESNAKAIKK